MSTVTMAVTPTATWRDAEGTTKVPIFLSSVQPCLTKKVFGCAKTTAYIKQLTQMGAMRISIFTSSTWAVEHNLHLFIHSSDASISSTKDALSRNLHFSDVQWFELVVIGVTIKFYALKGVFDKVGLPYLSLLMILYWFYVLIVYLNCLVRARGLLSGSKLIFSIPANIGHCWRKLRLASRCH